MATATVHLFASYAEQLGVTEIAIPLPEGAKVSDLVARIRSLPGASKLPPEPLVAINHRFAKHDENVRGTDEIALIPPVSGG